MTDVAVPVPPRIYAKGVLRKVTDGTPAAVSISVDVAQSPLQGIEGDPEQYVLIEDAVYSQEPTFRVATDGRWSVELVHAPGVVYRLACPKWMQTVYLYCDAFAPGSVVRYSQMATSPGGDTPVEYVTLQTVIASIDAKVASEVADQVPPAVASELPGALEASLADPASAASTGLATFMSRRVPSRQVSVAAMPSWTGDPADDQTAAFAEAAALYTGATTVLIPAGTWIVQGAPIREALYYVGEGPGIGGTTLVLPTPAAPDVAMFVAAHGGEIWSGGIRDVKIIGDGAERGDGATSGVRGIDLYRFTRSHGFWVTDCHIERFDVGIHGAQNNSTTYVGDDRWLIVAGCLIWDNKIGVYANEHPQIAGVDFRRNDIGLTGRLYDLNLVGKNKFVRNRIGIMHGDTLYGRTGFGSTIISSAIFFRNDVGAIIDVATHVVGCFFEGGIWNPVTKADTAGIAVGIRVKGRHCSIVGNFFNPTASVECTTDIEVAVESGRADLAVIGNAFRHSRLGAAVIKPQSGIDTITGLKFTANDMTLTSTSHGLLLHSDAITVTVDDAQISDNRAYFSGGGRFYRAGVSNDVTIKDNHITDAGGTARTLQIIWAGNTTTGYNTVTGNVLHVKDGTTTTAEFIRVPGDGLVLLDNRSRGGYPINIASTPTGDYRIRGNVGLATDASATVTMASGVATLVVTHGLITTPLHVMVSAINAQADLWVTSRTAISFTINRASTTDALVVAWRAAVYP